MSKVVDAGLQGDSSDCILDELDEATVAKIAKVLAPASSSRSVPDWPRNGLAHTAG